MKKLAYLVSVIFVAAAPSIGYAAQWTLGDRVAATCRRNADSRNIQYCHNCNSALGAGSYVSWEFKVKCDGNETRRRVRGELRCNNWPQEAQQRTQITNDAVGKLPGAGTACP